MSTFAGENSYELTGYGVPFTADTAGGTPDAAGGHGFASVEPKDTNDPRIDLLKDMAIKQAQRIDLQVLQHTQDRKTLEAAQLQVAVSKASVLQQQEMLLHNSLVAEMGEKQLYTFKKQYLDSIEQHHTNAIKCTAALLAEVLYLRSTLLPERLASLPVLSDAAASLPMIALGPYCDKLDDTSQTAISSATTSSNTCSDGSSQPDSAHSDSGGPDEPPAESDSTTNDEAQSDSLVDDSSTSTRTVKAHKEIIGSSDEPDGSMSDDEAAGKRSSSDGSPALERASSSPRGSSSPIRGETPPAQGALICGKVEPARRHLEPSLYADAAGGPLGGNANGGNALGGSALGGLALGGSALGCSPLGARKSRCPPADVTSIIKQGPLLSAGGMSAAFTSPDAAALATPTPPTLPGGASQGVIGHFNSDGIFMPGDVPFPTQGVLNMRQGVMPLPSQVRQGVLEFNPNPWPWRGPSEGRTPADSRAAWH